MNAIISHFLSKAPLSEFLLPARYIKPIGRINPKLSKLMSQISCTPSPILKCSAAQSNSAVIIIIPIKIARMIKYFIQGLRLFSVILIHF